MVGRVVAELCSTYYLYWKCPAQARLAPVDKIIVSRGRTGFSKPTQIMFMVPTALLMVFTCKIVSPALFAFNLLKYPN